MRKKEKKRLLTVFDFDGVICDSLNDSILTAVNTYLEIVSEPGIPFDRSLSHAEIFEIAKNTPQFFSQFSSLMPLAGNAGDYYILIKIIEKNLTDSMLTQTDFNHYKNSYPEMEIRDYEKKFYELRLRYQHIDLQTWLKSLPPFSSIDAALNVLAEKSILAISTAKDSRSIALLLRSYGLDHIIPPGNILTKEFSSSKKIHLEHLQKKNGIPFANIYFIDDKLQHLVAVKSLGVKAFLAVWGFNTSREADQAKEQGIGQIDLRDLPNIIA